VSAREADGGIHSGERWSLFGVIRAARRRMRRRRLGLLFVVLTCGGVVVFLFETAGSQSGGSAPSSHSSVGARTARPTVPRAPGPITTSVDVKRADFLTGVACESPRTCVAVGWFYSGDTGPYLSLAAGWNGGAWLAEPIPSRGHDTSLFGVSCASATACIAVGARDEVWNGARWTMIPIVGPGGSVSCVASGFCQAVGPPPFGRHVVAASWDGRSWRTEPMPQPTPSAQDLALTGVSCISARFCMAVGDYIRGVGARPSPGRRDRTLAEIWNGSRWRIVRTPNPSRLSQFRGVSCTSSTACTAVGSSAAGQWTLAERWNGRRWALQRTPNVNQVGYTALNAVSCASPTTCTAVGTYDLGAQIISEQWNGTRWAIHHLPTQSRTPAEGPFVPASVSCTSPTDCMTVGSSGEATLAERWNGSRWTIAPTPNPG